MGLFFPRPQPETQARSGPAGAPGALIGRGLADLLDQQGVDAAVGIVTRQASQAAVDDAAHPVDRQGGLGDIGRNDHLAFLVARHGGVLFPGRQFPV